MELLSVFVAGCMSARAAIPCEKIQSLWSGYGKILRMRLEGDGVKHPSVVVKLVAPPKDVEADISHLRKIRSYEVETAFYSNISQLLSADNARIPLFFGAQRTKEGEFWLVLEDLDAAGYPLRADSLDERGAESCLKWLAGFHATFLGVEPTGLWEVGTYWHLATRPDELRAMGDEGGLKRAAAEIDRRLSACRFRTLVHGDAKAANFCFSPDRRRVAAVDFQYVGGGCGVKDVCYLLACMGGWSGPDEATEARLLDFYFRELRAAAAAPAGGGGGGGGEVDVDALEAEWRALYPLAAADFGRFMAGWAGGGLGPRDRRLCRAALAGLGRPGDGPPLAS
jgi:aminoglycoside phosphotransferase (APT) family kinase protein